MFDKKFELKLYVPETWEVAGDMPERWARNLKAAAEEMNDRRKAKIPDDGIFFAKIARPANEAYGPYVAGGYISKSGRTANGITGSHRKNITGAFNKWNQNLDKAFETVDGVPAKFFKEKVDAAQDRWAIKVSDKTIRFTGDKIRGRSVAPIAAFYLVGDQRAAGWIKESDFANGAPSDISRPRQMPALKTAVQQRIIQGGMMVVNQEFNPDGILAENEANADLLNGMRDSSKCDAFVTTPATDKCFCSWAVNESGSLYLHLQVGLTV